MVQLIQVERKNFNSYLSTFSFSGRRSSLPFLILELRLGCIFEHTSSSDPPDFLHQLIWRVGQAVDHLMYVMHPILQTTPRVLGFIPGAVNTPVQWRNRGLKDWTSANFGGGLVVQCVTSPFVSGI